MNEPVVGLRGAKRMEEDGMVGDRRLKSIFRRRLRKAGIEKSGAITQPSNGRETYPGELIRENVSALDVKDADGSPVRATILFGEGNVTPGLADGPLRQRACTVVGLCVRIDQHAVRAIHAFAHNEHRLIFQAGISREKVSISAFLRCRQSRVIEQHRQPRVKAVAAVERCQMGSRKLVLRANPVGNVWMVTGIVFQPSVGIGDSRAKMFFDRIGASGL